MRRALAFLLLLCIAPLCHAGAVVREVRLQSQPDGSQLVLELSESVQHDSFLLANPPRLVVDLADTQLQRPAQTEALSSTQVRSVRSGVQDGRNLRIVLDLAEVYSHKAYLLPPDGQGGHRLVVEIGGSGAPVKAVLPTQPPAAGAVSQAVLRRKSPLVIVIDPGHGGKDPGAIGPSGVREKDVVLGIARRLRDLINREPGMRAVMTRDRDTFLPLRERISVARRHKADMFISIHADAVESGDAAGASVYMLSTKGASSEAARLLAERENAVDLVGGVKITHHDRDVASVLLDLSQDATLEASMLLARLVLRELGAIGPLSRTEVERAAFVVLKSPDVPSILVETAFISNHDEERKLASASHQQRVAESIMDAVRAYYQKRPPQQWLIAGSETAPAAVAAQNATPAPASVSARARTQAPLPAAKPTSATAATAPSSKPVLIATPASPLAEPLVLISAPAAAPAAPIAATRAASAARPARAAGKSMTKSARPVHVIQRGESLADIARRYRISIDNLRSANGLASNRLRVPVGTQLTIPVGDS